MLRNAGEHRGVSSIGLSPLAQPGSGFSLLEIFQVRLRKLRGDEKLALPALAVPKCDAKGCVAKHIAPLFVALSLAGPW